MTLTPVRMPAVNALDSVAAAASKRLDRPPPTNGASFADFVSQSLRQVDQSQSTAESLSHQYQLNRNDVSIEDAMLAAQKANISFQTTVQVRNKLVAAYNDIMNMQV